MPPKVTSGPQASGVHHSPRRHPVGGRVPDESNKKGRLRGRRGWVGLLLVFGVVFLGLRGIHALADQPEQSAIFTDRVVVVGVTGRPELTQTDRAVLGAHLGDAQAGTISIRPRYVGDCAAAGWTTLGAGRRAAVGGLCTPEVAGNKVADWPARQAAAAARRGDAQLGTLAGSTKACIAAVGPGAALAAAKPDGTVAGYQSPEEFVSGGMQTTCPITLVDGGPLSDQIITELTNRKDLTLIVTGVGPNAGSDDPSLQVVYRLGTTLPGWLTSASTRREGIVTLTDLTRTLIEFGGLSSSVAIDGSPFAVYDAGLNVERIDTKITSVAALSDAAPIGYLAVGLTGAVLFVIMVIFSFPRQVRGAQADLGTRWCAARRDDAHRRGALAVQRLTGVGRQSGGHCLVADLDAVGGAGGSPRSGSDHHRGRSNQRCRVHRRRRPGRGHAAWFLDQFATHLRLALVRLRQCDLCRVRQRRSAAGRLHRAPLLATGRRPAALVAVGVIGFGIVICEGWPSMGSDFGGVIALTPAVLWLMLALSGIRITWLKVLAIGGAAVLAVAVISVLDWLRGPDRRTHLGNFVQRILDGDALDVISRKALASAETIGAPVGIGSLLIGVLLWIVIFRFVVPRISTDFTTVRSTLIAALIVAILGTVLNDGGSLCGLP